MQELLPIAEIVVIDKSGKFYIKALLDSGSQSNFIAENLLDINK